ncbi:hypothetical protein [Pararhizobium qamdonense]|uniref:hypothetical protein n=1 Tax=Pararhizobium qamdonense TaxID=3031126 RepID=UPI0023E09D48|nr:hypothetical protein [Pararhizobium qamdonense]
MVDITATQIDDYAVMMGNGSRSTISAIGGISEAGAWIVAQLDEMIASGEYIGESVMAHEAVMNIAHKIEFGRIEDDARKPTADILRYLSQFVLQRRVPLS